MAIFKLLDKKVIVLLSVAIVALVGAFLFWSAGETMATAGEGIPTWVDEMFWKLGLACLIVSGVAAIAAVLVAGYNWLKSAMETACKPSPEETSKLSEMIAGQLEVVTADNLKTKTLTLDLIQQVNQALADIIACIRLMGDEKARLEKQAKEIGDYIQALAEGDPIKIAQAKGGVSDALTRSLIQASVIDAQALSLALAEIQGALTGVSEEYNVALERLTKASAQIISNIEWMTQAASTMTWANHATVAQTQLAQLDIITTDYRRKAATGETTPSFMRLKS